MSKAFVIDIAKCNGCYNCQIVCKDEHCGNDWSPYAKPQPEAGQFWCKLEEKVRGTVPMTRISYVPHIGAQTQALAEYAPEVLAPREDGLIVIDPEKAKGRKDLAEKFEGVFWNENLQIPQGCTGCAHLLDNGWTVPRCVDACMTDALRFGDVEDFGDELLAATQLDPQSHVYYINFPKRFVGGAAVDYEADEVIIGAKAELLLDGKVVSALDTDDFGDFKFDQVEAAVYEVRISADGHETITLKADATDIDVNLGYIDVKKA